MNDVEFYHEPYTNDPITIKGRGNTVAIQIGDGHWIYLLDILHERLLQSSGFFRGGQVALDVGPRTLLVSNLREVQAILHEHQMTLVWVSSSAEITCQVATDLGLMAEYIDELDDEYTVSDPIDKNSSDISSNIDNSTAIESGIEDNQWDMDESTLDEELPLDFVHRGHLRSGQVVKQVENVIVIGDVKAGATVISGGDILVFGRLRGVVHAGVMGNTNAIVCALDLSPTQLRIAGITAQSGESSGNNGRWFRRQSEQLPLVAHVINKKIMIEPLDQSKPSGLAILHRN